MSLVGYVRVSTTDQDYTTQLERVEAQGCVKVFSEKKSGATTDDRPELKACFEFLRKGDTFVFTKIDRVARSALDMLTITKDLTARGIKLLCIDQNMDASTPEGKAFMTVMAAFAELETNIRKDRQAEGIAAAKSKGKYNGRKPTAQAKASEVMALVEQGVTKAAIAEQVGISVASVYNVINAAKKAAALLISNRH